MDLTVVATPGYFGSMYAEYRVLRARAAQQGPTAADYERRDTIASLSMGVASLFAPLVMSKLLAPITPGKGRHGKKLLAVAGGAIALTTVADMIARRGEDAPGAETAAAPRASRRRAARWARRTASVGGVVAVVTGGVAVTTTLATRTKVGGFWRRGEKRDLGGGLPALLAATLAWDFIYYWNHRFMHESRYMWAHHVVHHSSERYNLSTALRQPVAEAFGTFLPYSTLAFVGIRPNLIESARGINLLYQYWIHTDTIRRLGRFESILNTPSHHRVHHGSNGQYIDRNHGSILIVWDRLFGTYEPEGEPVVYGLTKNIETFNPARIAAHEHKDMLLDVAQSRSWRERLSYVVRGPGWAYARHKERAGGEAAPTP
jgi:sterol desaturase/sphingolipid hydroxylase (fatty acid hydroxylase superfamily)